MKRATLTTYSATPAAQPTDLTDRLLAGQSGPPSAPAARKRSGRKPAAAASAPAASPAAPTTSGLENALVAVETATAALRQAGQEAPARYEVALRFRLDALAHHLQQVKEFITSVTIH